MKEGSNGEDAIVLSKSTPAQIARAELPPITAMRQLLPQFVVDSHERFQEAGAFAAGLQAEYKRIKGLRDAFIDPAKAWVSMVSGTFAPVLSAYEKAVDEFQAKMVAYSRKVEDERQAAMRAQAAPEAAPPAAIVQAPPVAKGTNIRYETRVRVVYESQVPRDFCSPDLKKIADWYQSTGGSSIPYPDGIPGVETYSHPIATTRAAK